MAKVKEFEISMVCYNLENKYTLEEINDMFVDWAESKDIYAGGSIKDCVEEESSNENNGLNLQNVSNNEVAVCDNCRRNKMLLKKPAHCKFCGDRIIK